MKKLIIFLMLPLIFSTVACSDKSDDTIIVEKAKPEPEPNYRPEIGRWNFDNSNDLLAAKKGYNLELVGTHTAVAGPSEKNGAIEIGIGSYYKVHHGIQPNGGGSYVNEYSLMFDIKITDNDTWKALFNANQDNANDAECFIKPEGTIGLAAPGYTDYALSKNEWYRIVITIGLGNTHRYYIDGQLAKEGTPQSIDGAFSLDDIILLFADNDGEDGKVQIAEIAMWNCVLTADEVLELDGYDHSIPKPIIKMTPYLQQPDATSLIVCWHDNTTEPQSVEYGVATDLGQTQSSIGEVVSGSYIWHTAKLTGLKENTVYFYQIKGNKGTSEIFKFKTQPAIGSTQKIRFVLFSDTQENPTKTTEIVSKAKAKVEELYGSDLHNQINFVMHTGDAVHSGSTISQYTDQYFNPMAPFSSSVPFLITPGNHELEHEFFYKYIYNNDISGQPSGNANFERYWSKQIGNSLLIGLNSTKLIDLKTEQKTWLKNLLDAAEVNNTIDFVFCFVHELPFSEMWGQGKNEYVANEILPLIQQYNKVQQLSYGHVHSYERGIIESKATNKFGDITLLAAGGGGGTRDRWGEYANNDYQQINMTVDHHFYVICEIDVSNKSYKFETYSLGNNDYPLNNVLIDSWTRDLKKIAPNKPIAQTSSITGNDFVLKASNYSGVMPIFSSQFDVAEVGANPATVISSIRDIRNIYGIDSNFKGVDKNEGIDLTEFSLSKSDINESKQYVWRVRYRDTNRRWSEWSEYKGLE